MVSLSDGDDPHFRKAWFDPSVAQPIARGLAPRSARHWPSLPKGCLGRTLLWLRPLSAGVPPGVD